MAKKAKNVKRKGAVAGRAAARSSARTNSNESSAAEVDGVKVRALGDLHYDHKYYRRGDVLTVPKHYFEGDMAERHRALFEEVDPRTPAKVTSSNQSLREETLGGRTKPGQQTDADNPTGAADVLGDQLANERK